MTKRYIGVDTGGTFTDFVEIDESGIVTFDKTFSTPRQPEQGIMQVLEQYASDQSVTVEELLAWGPKNELRATVPNVPRCGRLQGPRVQPLASKRIVEVVQPDAVPGGVVANHPKRPGSETWASPTRMGRHGPVSLSEPQSR